MNNKLIAGLGVLTLTACQQNTDDLIIEDFESGTYANWTVEGDAFGATPATGSYTGQQPVIGFEGTASTTVTTLEERLPQKSSPSSAITSTSS